MHLKEVHFATLLILKKHPQIKDSWEKMALSFCLDLEKGGKHGRKS
jgi:hypothetical protein